MSVNESIDTTAAVVTTSDPTVKTKTAPDPSTQIATKPTTPDPNERNKALIELGNCKYPGQNNHLLIESVLETIARGANMDVFDCDTNAGQIDYAKHVWNNSQNQVRKLFLSTNSDWFIKLASNAEMVPIITAALDKFESSIGKSAGNPGGQAAYDEICEKYKIAKALESTNPGPFDFVQLSDGQKRLIKKFEAKQDAASGPVKEPAYPNQNAVTYPFILAKLCILCGFDEMSEDELNDAKMMKKTLFAQKAIVEDVLLFIAVHGQKSVTSFLAAISALSVATGPTCNVDLKPRLIQIGKALTKGTNNEDDKLLANHVLTLKRLIRVVYITTPNSTVWGLMDVKNDFTKNVIDLYNKEKLVESRDMNSLSMVWYMCIGRQNICSIMVDHHELSASNIMADMIGKTVKSTFPKPNHVFPLRKDHTKRFNSILPSNSNS